MILEARDGRFSLRILDDGPGIPEDQLARLPERRFRGETALTRHPEGSGLGLYIVRSLVEAGGGRVTAASEGEGRGAAFTVRLPRHEGGSS